MTGQQEIDELTSNVIGSAIAVHRELGPGLLESVYQKCMVLELRSSGVVVESEVPVPITYKGELISNDGMQIGRASCRERV